MPAWLVALIVALVGFAGASLRLAHDRVADLRARMLDAADDFVTALTEAHDAISTAALPTGAWVEIAWMEDLPQHIREDRTGKVDATHAAARAAWDASRQRVPRVALLFGVGSPAAEAAKRADDALGEALVGLSKAYAESYADEPPAENVVAERAYEQLEVADFELQDFSAAAHTAIVGGWWQMLPWQLGKSWQPAPTKEAQPRQESEEDST